MYTQHSNSYWIILKTARLKENFCWTYNMFQFALQLLFKTNLAHAKYFQSAFTSCFPVMDLNNGDSSLHRLPYKRLLTDSATTCFGYNISAWDAQKTPFVLVLQAFPWEWVRLWRRYPVTALVYLLILQSLPSNGCRLFRGHYPVTAAYTCLLRICFLAVNIVSLFVSRLLPCNSSTRYSI
jgi:hypothetical protein